MRTLSIFLMLSLMTVAGWAQSSDPVEMTLEEALAYALGNSEQLKITELDMTNAEAEVKEIVSYGLPQAEINGGLNYNYEVQTSLVDASNFDPSIPEGTLTEIQFGLPYDGNAVFGINQLIFDGAYFVGIEAAKTFRELSRKENERAKIDVVEGVAKAYYTVLINETNAQLMQDNYNRLDTLLRETEQMYENGFAEKIDADRIRVSYNNVGVNLETNLQLLEVSKKLLNFQMGMALDQELVLTTKLEDVNLSVPEVPVQFDYNERIEYSQLQTNQSLAVLDRKNYKSQYLPKMYAGFNYGFNSATSTGGDLFSQKWFDFGSLGVTMSIPVFDGFYKRAKVQQTQITIDQLDYQKQILEKSIDIEIKQSQINLESSLKILEVQEQNEELARNIFDITRVKFQEGIGSNLELTDADNEYKTAQANYITALYNSIISKIDLLKALGTLHTSN